MFPSEYSQLPYLSTPLGELLPVTFGGRIDMTPSQMRNYVLQAYPGPKWKAKVQKMSDQQIAAVYFRLINKK